MARAIWLCTSFVLRLIRQHDLLTQARKEEPKAIQPTVTQCDAKPGPSRWSYQRKNRSNKTPPSKNGGQRKFKRKEMASKLGRWFSFSSSHPLPGHSVSCLEGRSTEGVLFTPGSNGGWGWWWRWDSDKAPHAGLQLPEKSASLGLISQAPAGATQWQNENFLKGWNLKGINKYC